MQVKKPEKRERIIEVGKRLMAEKGIDGFSMEDIAREAGVGKGTVYIYFRSKEELLRGIVRSVYWSFIEDLKEASKSESFREFVERLVELMLRDAEFRGGVIHSIRRSSFDSKDLHAEFGREFGKNLEEVYSKFENVLVLDFDSFYFSITGLLMSSYIFIDDMGKEKIGKILKESILRISTCRMDFGKDHSR